MHIKFSVLLNERSKHVSQTSGAGVHTCSGVNVFQHFTSSQMAGNQHAAVRTPGFSNTDETRGWVGDRSSHCSREQWEASKRRERRSTGQRMSALPPRPLCLTDEFKQDMVIVCLQHSPNHKSLCKKNGKAIS